MPDDEIIVTNFSNRGGSIRRLTLDPRSTLTACVVLGMAAACIHAYVVREHLAHWWGYGAFFVFVAVAQAAAAVLLIGRPSRRLLTGVAIANAGLIGLYILSRTQGTPFLGPHAGRAEPVGAIDLVANAAEVVQAALAVALLRRATVPARRLRIRWMALALAALTTLAVGAPVGRVHVPALASVAIPPGAPTVDHDMSTPASDPIVDALVEEEPPPEDYTHCTPRTADGGGAVSHAEPGTARAVLYQHDGDLWIATMADGTVRRLSLDGFECGKSAAIFDGDESITFVVETTIYSLDLKTGELDEIVEDPHGVAALAWNGNGTELAYMTWGGTDGTLPVKIFDRSTKSTRTLATLGAAGGGRCGSMDDEVALSWSPGGTRIMVVATYLDFGGETIFVVDTAAGSSVVAPRKGTHARWLADDDSVVYREFDGDRRWYSLNLATGSRSALPMKAGTHHAAVSPNGRLIVTTDEAASPRLYLYDIVTREEQELTTGYAAAIWLSSHEIAATKTKPCEDEMCGHGLWTPAGSTAAFGLSGTRTRTLPMASTMDAAILMEHGESSHAAPSPESTPTPTPPPPTPSPSPSPEPPLPPISPPAPSPDPSPTPTEEPPTPTPSPSPSDQPAS